MNEEKTKTNKDSLKYFLFIGIPVVVILAILGGYYYLTNPVSIMTQVINNSAETISKLLPKNEISLSNESVIEVAGNISFNTNMNLGDYEEIKNYNYDISALMDPKKEFLSLNLGINEKDRDILHGRAYLFNNKMYLESPKLTDQIILVEDCDTDEDCTTLNPFENMENISWNNEEWKKLIQETKTILIESLDKKQIEREKVDTKINDKTMKLTKVSYPLTNENQNRIIDEMLKNDNFLNHMSKITTFTKEEIITQLKEEKAKTKTESKIEIYTEGFQQTVKKVHLTLENNDIVYIDDETKTITFDEQTVITIHKLESNHISLTIQSGENAKINIETIAENDNNISMKISCNIAQLNFELNLKFEINRNATYELPDVSNAKTSEELSPTEILQIYTNLEDALEGTLFSELLTSNML